MSRFPNATQEMFARHFALKGDVVSAYRATCPDEDVTHRQAYSRGYALFRSSTVRERVLELRNEAAVDVLEVTRALAAHYLDVLNAPRDIVQHVRGACRYCWGVAHRYQWAENQYLEALEAAEAANRARGAGQPETALPDPSGGFGYDPFAEPCPDCPHCLGRGEGRTFVRDTSDLAPAEAAAFEGLELKAHGALKVNYMSKADAAAGLMKLFGLGAENVRLLAKVEVTAAPDVPDDPRAAAEVYKNFLTGPS